MASRQDFPTSTVAKRVRELRTRRGLTAEQLADRMREVGVPFDKTVIANLETGRRRFVTVQEVLALALVLDVAPLHLMVSPTDAEQSYAVTPQTTTLAVDAREWVRGRAPMPTQDQRIYFSEVPDYEWEPPRLSPGLRDLLRRGGDDGER